jgi:hypothetical protein
LSTHSTRNRQRETSRPDGCLALCCKCCRVTKAEESNCKLTLPRQGIWCSISGTLYQENHSHPGKLSDHIVFWEHREDQRAGAVELKSRNPRASAVAEQLQKGADLADTLARSWTGLAFAAAVFHQGINAVGIRAIGRHRVKFRGKRYRIQIKPCGTKFQQLFE